MPVSVWVWSAEPMRRMLYCDTPPQFEAHVELEKEESMYWINRA